MKILVIRHAATDSRPSAGPIGRADVPIVGRHEDVARGVLAALAGMPVTTVWSSPLSRCAATARLVAAARGVRHVLDERLLEIDYGAWEGHSWPDIARTDAAAYTAWLQDWEHTGPPAGESARAVALRAAAWLAGLTPEGAPHLLVGHAGFVRALHVLCAGLSWPQAMAIPVPHFTFGDGVKE